MELNNIRTNFRIILSCLFVITIDNFIYCQYKWEFYESTYIIEVINDYIKEGRILQTKTNNYYQIKETTRQKVNTRNPNVTVLNKGSEYKLIIDDFDDPVICNKLNLG